MNGPTEGEKQAQLRGTMMERIDGLVGDIHDIKTEQTRQGDVQVGQGKEITKLNVKVAIAGMFGGMAGSLIVGLILLFAQKGTP